MTNHLPKILSFLAPPQLMFGGKVGGSAAQAAPPAAPPPPAPPAPAKATASARSLVGQVTPRRGFLSTILTNRNSWLPGGSGIESNNRSTLPTGAAPRGNGAAKQYTLGTESILGR